MTRKASPPPDLGGKPASELSIARGLVLALTLVTVAGLNWPVAAQSPERIVPQSRGDMVLSFAPVVKTVAPSVVNVQTRKAVAPRAVNPFADDPFFSFFFRDFPTMPRQERRRVEQSLGSGVIVRADGLVVTNHHVIEGADEIEVILSDRREFEAEVITTDERSDLALLRIDPGDEALPPVELGDSDAIEVGDLVLALGNPFGIGQTVTSGIISATARTAPEIDSDVSFIQTDAAVNPGNSGGALVTLDGKLIGINTAIFTRGGGSIGIGFAIPSKLLAARIASVERGVDGSQRPWLGIAVEAVEPDVAAALGMRHPRGVIVRELYPVGAADRAGLEIGDVVLAVDGYEIRDNASLNFRLALGAIGDPVTLDVLRDGDIRSVNIDLEAPIELPLRNVNRLPEGHPLNGIVVGNLSPAFNEELGVDMFERGVAVLEVYRNTRAARMRLRPRDILVAIDGTPVISQDELNDLLAQRGEVWRLSIKRDGRVQSVSIQG